MKVYLIGPIDKGNVPTNGVTMKNQLFEKRFKELFVKVIAIDTWKLSRKPWNILKVLKALFTRNANIIISGGHSARRIFNLSYKLKLKNNIYFWVAGGSLPSAIESGLYDINALNTLKAVIVQGVSMRDALTSLGVKNAVYVPNSKPVEFIPDIVENKDKVIRFVFLSRVHPDKGCDDIIKAVKALNEQGYENRFEVDFYGSVFDSYSDSFYNGIKPLKNVKYKGFLDVTRQKGYETLSNYDVMLFPTYWEGEGFPGVVIDAYIAGLPIIATDWNLNKEVIKEGETGFIIGVKKPDELEDRMIQFIEGKFNLYAMRLNCLEYAKQFDFRNVLSEELMKSLGLL